MPTSQFVQNWGEYGEDKVKVHLQADNHVVQVYEVRDKNGSVRGKLTQKLKISAHGTGSYEILEQSISIPK